jgi:hypothetical protein
LIKSRISYYVQLVSFTMALVVPALAVLIGVGLAVDVLYCAGYAWGVGLTAALWHRLTVAE